MNVSTLTADMWGFWNGYLEKELGTGLLFYLVMQWKRLPGNLYINFVAPVLSTVDGVKKRGDVF